MTKPRPFSKSMIKNAALLTTSRGHGFKSAASFGGWFGKMAREAGVMKNCHGLRKLSASIMAEGGASNRVMQTWYGWTSDNMVNLYPARPKPKGFHRLAMICWQSIR